MVFDLQTKREARIIFLIFSIFYNTVNLVGQGNMEKQQDNQNSKQTILITGGAGYIGSAVAYYMAQAGHKVIIIDKLVHGQKFDHKWAELIVSDFSDEQVLADILTKNKIDAVVHCAASIEVGISVKSPKDFYENNVVKTLKLLNTLVKYNIKKVIFSSTCAVYGLPKYLPLTEDHPKEPISAYGNTKLTMEFILNDYQIAYGLSYVALRYFNAAGAIVDQNLGEIHEPETHLIPIIIDSVFKNKVFKVFGSDYKTQDGTNIRDYLHIKDIATAHIKALNLLDNGVRCASKSWHRTRIFCKRSC